MEKYKHHLHMTKLLHNGYNDLVISNTFRNFGLSLISIFLPVYLLGIGVTFQELLYFELGVLIISLVSHFIINAVLNHVGVKKILVLSYLLSMAFYALLHKSELFLVNIGVGRTLGAIAIMSAALTTFYWTAYHYYFVKATHTKDKGRKLSILVSVPVILSVVSPFVGGIIIEESGFSGAFIAAAILIFIGMIFLFFSKDIRVDTNNNLRNIVNHKYWKKNLIFVFEGMSGIAGGFLWPVLLFYMSIKIVMMGFFYLISNSLFSITTIWSGKMVDKKEYHIIKYGVVGHAVTYIARIFARSVLSIVSIQGLGGMFMPLWSIPVHSLFYKKSEDKSSDSIMNREFWMHIGRISIFVVLIILSYHFSILTVLTAGMVFCGLMMLGLNLVIKELF